MTRSAFDDALDDLRISGSILLHESYPAPWAIGIPGETELRRLTKAGPEIRVIPFHFVRDGVFVMRLADGTTANVNKGEVIICPGSQPHVMSFGQRCPVIPFGDILQQAAPMPRGDGSVSTSLLCGVFFLRGSPLNPLLASLPPLLKVSCTGEEENLLLMQAASMLCGEAGRGNLNGFSSLRLLEVFCAEAIFAYRRGSAHAAAGWFKALDDPRLSPAIAHVHAHPGELLSVELLAKQSGLSPSRFAARFREEMGVSVMTYVSRWRMNVACGLLRDTSKGLSDIAVRVGYQDVAAFSRAFKSTIGMSPTRWRRPDSGQQADVVAA